MGGDGSFQVEALGVAVHPNIVGGLSHRGHSARRWTKQVLIRPHSRSKGVGTGAFHRFGSDEGHGRGQALRQMRSHDVRFIKNLVVRQAHLFTHIAHGFLRMFASLIAAVSHNGAHQ
jgi:hypothetical protein